MLGHMETSSAEGRCARLLSRTWFERQQPLRRFKPRYVRGAGSLFRRSLLACCMFHLWQPAYATDDDYPRMPNHWNHPVMPGYRSKRILLIGADTVMGINAAKDFHRDCAHLYLVAALPENAEAARIEIESEAPPAGRCPPGTSAFVGAAAGDVEDESFAFEVTSNAYKAMGGIDMTQNFAKISPLREIAP
mmetsp:Transcript_42353/g.67043  ORF Transcript_42353/g.67043 Transcript_42353/m.67043 type:complete len:191 (-) Transcript_42353:85-657(-)